MKKFIPILVAALSLLSACNKQKETVLGPARLNIITEGISGTVQLLYPSERAVLVRMEAKDLPDQSVVIALNADPSLVDAYNQTHNTHYKAAPSEICSFTKDLILPRFNRTSTEGKMILKSAVLSDDDEYLLPLVPEIVSGKQDVQCETLYLVVKRFALDPPTNLNKSGWTMVYRSSEEIGNYSGQGFVRKDDPSSSQTGYAKDLLDGDYGSIWAFGSGSGDMAPFYFVIDMGKSYTIRQLDIWAQRGNRDMGNEENTTPSRQCAYATVEFATTLTGDGMGDLGGYGEADWFGRESFGSDVLANRISNSVYLSELRYARYIRFTYINCYYAATDTSPRTTYTGGSLAELDFWGYNKKIVLQ
ncbi:MAG: DUF1735 domain-containing protein [Bacteroidales bacterium]|nr:DUF1735 domain-containing protein [Bacteroidales bacterium]